GETAQEENIGQPGQRPVPDPSSHRHAVSRREKPGAVDDAGVAAEDGLQQPPVLLGIQFEIGILDQDDLPRRESKTQADCRPLSEVDFAVIGPNPRIAGPLTAIDRGTRAVARSVVGDDDLLLDVAEIDGAYPFDELADRLLLVVDRDDYRKLHQYD